MKHIAVLGTGESINLYAPTFNFDRTIGVNDVWRIVKTDELVVLNHARDFTPERYRIIIESRPAVFYSQIVNWDFMPGFEQIKFANGYPESSCNIERIEYEKSYCSPFVAVQIAYKKYRPDEIHLFGIDMIKHPHLDHKLCESIKRHFRNLKRALDAKNVKMIVHGNGILTKL